MAWATGLSLTRLVDRSRYLEGAGPVSQSNRILADTSQRAYFLQRGIGRMNRIDKGQMPLTWRVFRTGFVVVSLDPMAGPSHGMRFFGKPPDLPGEIMIPGPREHIPHS